MAFNHPSDFQWAVQDPFLVCGYQKNAYPPGNAELGPAESLAGRNLGSDLSGKDGWSMYFGRSVPGFPAHPHRGFETISIVRRGYIDHSDSLGARARFSQGDVQWLTAGAGIVHCEMFPLLKRDAENPFEMFQIWLNLPKRNKFAPPHFSMMWKEAIPRFRDTGVEVTVIAGALGDIKPLAAPRHSWASLPESHLAIWNIRLDADSEWTLPRAEASAVRTLCVFAGGGLEVAGTSISNGDASRHAGDSPITMRARNGACEVLLLQARPIAEPTVVHGPFVMNNEAEVAQAVADFRRTRFGRWPWRTQDPNHGPDEGRFAQHANGNIERPDG